MRLGNEEVKGSPVLAAYMLVADRLQLVEREIERACHSEIALVRRNAEYLHRSGGKRLRPAMVLLCAQACGYEGDHDVPLGAVVEFIHTATLLHDDVVDDSDMRRGQQAASTIWGNEAAVLVGDYLYSRAFQMMIRAQSMPIMDLLANTTNVIAQGEVLQLLNVHDADTTEARYQEVIYAKTACLFEAAARIGAILGKVDGEREKVLQAYGKHLGIAFQLIDDALDYSAQSDELGKNVGDDLAEGKPTLPLIRAMEVGTESQRELIRNAIKTGNIDSLDDIRQVIEETGSLRYTIEQAQAEAASARHAIAGLDASEYRQAMMFLADYAVERSY